MNIILVNAMSLLVTMMLPKLDALGVTKIQQLTADANRPVVSAGVQTRDELEVLAIAAAMSLVNSALQKFITVPATVVVAPAVPTAAVEGTAGTTTG